MTASANMSLIYTDKETFDQMRFSFHACFSKLHLPITLFKVD